MKNRSIKYIINFCALLLAIPASAQLIPVLGSQRAGTAMGAFLKIGVGSRAVAMGGAFVAVANDASALYWNPAGITQIEQNQISFAHTEWVLDIQHEYLGYVHKLSPTSRLGLSVLTLHTDEWEETTTYKPTGSGNYVRYGDIAVGLTYAKKMTDRFSLGFGLKYFDETLDTVHARNLFFDFGTFFKTGFGSSRFAVSVTNFGTNIKPSGSLRSSNGDKIDDWQDFAPPTIFRFGFAGEFIDTRFQKLTASAQLNHPNDNAENFSLGLEYWWRNMLATRGGYQFNADEKSWSVGAGLALPLKLIDFNVDVAYSGFGVLGNISRFSATIGF